MQARQGAAIKKWPFDIGPPHPYIRCSRGLQPARLRNGGAPVSTGTKKYETHTEAHVLVKTWKTTNC